MRDTAGRRLQPGPLRLRQRVEPPQVGGNRLEQLDRLLHAPNPGILGSF
jgi:hypothetical protein